MDTRCMKPTRKKKKKKKLVNKKTFGTQIRTRLPNSKSNFPRAFIPLADVA